MKTSEDYSSLQDCDLVLYCRGGDRNAFGQIVERYQSLVSGIAYNICGDLGRSEDLAQDTFVAAWKNLLSLDDPGKLKSWLCGIARNIALNYQRQRGRHPESGTTVCEETHLDSTGTPRDNAISKEEEELLWRTLEKIPETYREPMILFYRQGQSTEAVAAALGISPENVRQRLSRGRAMLNDQIAAIIESTLFRSAPGKLFTLGVIAALPVFATPAKAATVGATGIAGGSVKTFSFASIIGFFQMFIQTAAIGYLGYQLIVISADSQDEKRKMKRAFFLFWAGYLLSMGGVIFLMTAGYSWWHTYSFYKPLLVTVFFIMVSIFCVFVFWWSQLHRLFQRAEAAQESEPVRIDYCSKWSFLGLPLVRIRFGDPMNSPSRIIKAWIAVGDIAIGGLFAFGGVAIAPISIGGIAIGMFSWGAIGLGLLAVGGVTVGAWAFGGLAIGILAFGFMAIGSKAAAAAIHMPPTCQCSTAVKEIIETHPFFQTAIAAFDHLFWLNLLWIVPLFVFWFKLRAKRRAFANVLSDDPR